MAEIHYTIGDHSPLQVEPGKSLTTGVYMISINTRQSHYNAIHYNIDYDIRLSPWLKTKKCICSTLIRAHHGCFLENMAQEIAN